jgi:hypothetical protein
VLYFVCSHTFAPSDFVLNKNSVCRLHPQLAKQMVRLALNDTAVHDAVVWLPQQLTCRANRIE